METIKDNNSTVMATPSPLGDSFSSPARSYKVFPDARDVAFPGFSGTVRLTGAYARKFAASVRIGEGFVFAKAFKDGVYDDLNKVVLPGVKAVGTYCRILAVRIGDFASSVEYEGLEIVNLSDFDFDLAAGLVTCHVTLKRDVANDPLDLNQYLSKFQLTYARLRQKYAALPDLPDLSRIPLEKAPFLLANFIDSDVSIKQNLLECVSAVDRFKFLINDLDRFNQDSKIDYELDRAVNKALDRNQREFILREKMKALKEMLREFDGDDSDGKYEKALAEHPDMYPDYVKKRIRDELDHLKTMPGGAQEISVIKGYLDLVIKLPWRVFSNDNEDIVRVKEILDADHYGLVKQKERVLEYLAVKTMTKSLKAPILCLYGPPGVGKTSLAYSVAHALGRKFAKISLGGISDEAEIRGHRRTYVGAMPGKIISTLAKTGVNNPVILLDEIDKIQGGGFHGDPAAALLEVLDPEQNSSFEDNYLDMPFDLSNVLFICTANDLSQIPSPLLDRLELVELNTYTKFEKMNIAKEHLIPLEEKANGIKPEQIAFEDGALNLLIESYTQEAGVRELRRKIGTIMRKFAVEYLKDPAKNSSFTVTPQVVKKFLGKSTVYRQALLPSPQVGVVNGLAYTMAGGEVLRIEVDTYDGKGALIRTGNIGNVMQEACLAALSYIKNHASDWGIDPKWFDHHDIHIHFPDGATPKDGPSAGIATALVLLSAITGVPIRNDVAMTGEIDLRGNALPIGGLREKTLAALRQGVKTVFVPKDNDRDVQELPEPVLRGLDVREVSNLEEVIKSGMVEDPAKLKAEIAKRTRWVEKKEADKKGKRTSAR